MNPGPYTVSPFGTGGGRDPHHSGGRAAITSAVEPASVAASAEGARVVCCVCGCDLGPGQGHGMCPTDFEEARARVRELRARMGSAA